MSLAAIYFRKGQALRAALLSLLRNKKALHQALQPVNPLQRLTRGQRIRVEIFQRFYRRRGLFRGGEQRHLRTIDLRGGDAWAILPARVISAARA